MALDTLVSLIVTITYVCGILISIFKIALAGANGVGNF